MKMSSACPCMLSSENDDFKFLKNCEKYQMRMHHVHQSFRARVTVLSLQTSLLLTRNMNVTVAKELYYIFSKISKFRYWYIFIDAEYIRCHFKVLTCFWSYFLNHRHSFQHSWVVYPWHTYPPHFYPPHPFLQYQMNQCCQKLRPLCHWGVLGRQNCEPDDR